MNTDKHNNITSTSNVRDRLFTSSLRILDDIRRVRTVGRLQFGEEGMRAEHRDAAVSLGVSPSTGNLCGLIGGSSMFVLINEGVVTFAIDIHSWHDPFDDHPDDLEHWIQTEIVPLLPSDEFEVQDSYFRDECLTLYVDRPVRDASEMLRAIDAMRVATETRAFPTEYDGPGIAAHGEGA